MPELPEVETIRRQLDSALKGKVVQEIDVLRKKSFSGEPDMLEGYQIEKVERKAKTLIIRFRAKEELVMVHLKMTGQLIYLDKKGRIVGGHPTPDWVNDLPSKHTRVIWTFRDGAKLFFNDMRVFGWMKILDVKSYEKGLEKEVPDVNSDLFTIDYLFNLLKKSSKPIKLFLLDQGKVGGLGNIYVNDALYLAKIDPRRKTNSLTEKEAEKLRKASRDVIEKGIKYGGASASNYVQVSGLGGTYQDHFLVYKKDGQKCKVCGTKIEKIKLGGRGTFFCPNCQK